MLTIENRIIFHGKTIVVPQKERVDALHTIHIGDHHIIKCQLKARTLSTGRIWTWISNNLLSLVRCAVMLLASHVIACRLVTTTYCLHIYKCASSVDLLCSLLDLHIYTRATLKAWPMLISGIDLIGQLIMYVFHIYNFQTYEFLWAYCH